MDSEEVALDWGGNEDEETTTHHEQTKNQGQPPKDEATLSLVAESLLALRQTSGPEGLDEHDQEDRYSDAVSLGGGDEDDMEQLHAYQSRTHLGSLRPTDRKSAQTSHRSSERTDNEERKHRRSSVTRSPPTSAYSDSPKTTPLADEQSPRFSPRDRRSRSKPHHEERTDSPSLHRLPTGSLALPPRPTGPIKAPFVHPSNPAMMSASSMAPASRERDRDAAGTERRAQQTSLDDDMPLAPNWEVRTARDGTGDQYYYNTKTHESTWHRSVATDLEVDKISSSDRVKDDQGQVSGRRSPPPLLRSLNGSQQRNRPVRGDDGLSPGSPRIAFRDRHYSSVAERDDGRSQRPITGDSRTRKSSPSPHLTAYPVSHRGNDRDISIHSRREREERPSFKDNRNGERRVDRSRSRSPARGQWRNNAVAPASWDRAGRRPPSDERHEEAARRGGPVSPSHDGFRMSRASSLGRDIGARYTPNHEQSSFRDRQRSPPPPPPRKRTRSRSPDSRRPVISQPIASGRRWEEPDRPRDQPYGYSGPPRDRPPQGSDLPFDGQRLERFTRDDRSIDIQNSRTRGFDRENEVKRRRTSDHPDSTPARRFKGNDDREYANEDQHLGRKRAPLPPQDERFREVAIGPPSTGFSRNVPPRDDDPPQQISRMPPPPPPPVRREVNDSRGLAGSGHSPRFSPNDISNSNRYYDRDRTWNRDRERNTPPDVSRSARGIKESDGFDRRGPPPARSSAMTPMLIPSDAYRAREAREERSSATHSRPFDGADRGPGQQSRSAGSHMDGRYNRPPAHQARPPFNSSGSSSGVPASLPNRGRDIDTARDVRDPVPNDRDIRLGPDRGESFNGAPFQGPRRGSSFSKGPIDDFPPNSAKPRASFSPQVPIPPLPEGSRPPQRPRAKSFHEQQPASFSPQEKPPSRWGPGGGTRPVLDRGGSSEAPGMSRRPPSPLLAPASQANDKTEFEFRTPRSPNTTSFKPPSRDGPPQDSYNYNQAPGRYDREKDEPASISDQPTLHPERARLLSHQPPLPPPPPPPPATGRRGGPPFRGRSYQNFDSRDAKDDRPSDTAPPPPGRLLDRISNPVQSASPSDVSISTFPSLRERVSGPPDNRKGGGGQWSRGNTNVSLRDRLEESNAVEVEASSYNNRRGNGNGSWRGGYRDRGRRGRGQ